MSALGDYGDRALIFKDDAERAKASCKAFLRRNLTVDTAVQIALLNNRGLQSRLQRTRAGRSRSCRGEPAAQSGVFYLADFRRWCVRDRTTGRWRHSLRWQPCRSARRLPVSDSRRAQLRAAEEDTAPRGGCQTRLLSRGRRQRARRSADGGQVDRGNRLRSSQRNLARPDL